jgi:hypothetical protein
VRRPYASVQRGRVSSLTTLIPLFPQTLRRECAHLCNVDDHLLPPPPFMSRVGPLCNVDRLLLSNLPPRRERARLCNVGRHLLTSLSPLLLLLPPDTPGGRLIRRGNRLPSRSAPCPANRVVTRPCLVSRDLRHVLRPTTRPRLTSRDLRHNLRPATSAAPYVPRLAPRDLRFPRRSTTCVTSYARCSLYPRDLATHSPCSPYIIPKNRTNSYSNRISKHRLNLTSNPPCYSYLSPSETLKQTT